MSQYKKDSAKRGEIAECTIPNCCRATKLFFDMNDIVMNWKKISRGLPHSGKAANDRAQTLKETIIIIEFFPGQQRTRVY
jgi:hypothetical protein